MTDRQATRTEPAAEAAGSPPKRYELVFTLALAILVAAIAWQSLSLPLYAFDGTVGPGFFPLPLSLTLLAGLLCHAAVLLAQIVRSPAVKSDRIVDKSQFVAVALVAVSALVGSFAGLSVAIIVLLLGGLVMIERLPVLESLAFSIVSLVLFYLVFDLWLGQNIGLSGIL